MTLAPETTGVYRIYIRATAAAIWQAITDPAWTVRYGYGGYAHYDLRPGGTFRHLPDEKMQAAAAEYGFACPEVIVDGEVIEAEAPRLLKTTWRMLMDPTTTAEGFTTITFQITELDDGYCSLTVVHECPTAPATLFMVSGSGDAKPNEGGGGHPWILSDLKSLLETGKGLAG
jgi:uncharacterized protein YndB with AHSA1/START domain